MLDLPMMPDQSTLLLVVLAIPQLQVWNIKLTHTKVTIRILSALDGRNDHQCPPQVIMSIMLKKFHHLLL